MESRLLRYAVTGGSAAIVDVGGFALLAALRMPVVLAATCSFLAATVVNFLLSSRWVFYKRATVRRYGSFLSGSLFSLLVNVTVTSICDVYLEAPRGVSKIVAVGVTFLFSYWINARLVFGSTSDVNPPSLSDR